MSANLVKTIVVVTLGACLGTFAPTELHADSALQCQRIATLMEQLTGSAVEAKDDNGNTSKRYQLGTAVTGGAPIAVIEIREAELKKYRNFFDREGRLPLRVRSMDSNTWISVDPTHLAISNGDVFTNCKSASNALCSGGQFFFSSASGSLAISYEEDSKGGHTFVGKVNVSTREDVCKSR